MRRLGALVFLVVVVVLVATGEVGPLLERLSEAIADPIAEKLTEIASD